MEKNILETEYVYYKLVNGLVIGTYKFNIEIDLNAAKLLVNARLKISGGKSYPLLIDGRGLKSINREAREYFSSDKGREGVTAAALVADSVFTTYLCNFFIGITVFNPKIPTKLFTDKTKALKWLEQFKR